MDGRSLIFAAGAFACALLLPLHAQAQAANGVAWVSGGVGSEAREQMFAERDRYNLRLAFAVEKSGNYLADVATVIRDDKGATALQATSDGPLLYARLPAGKYRIAATFGDRTLTAEVTLIARRSREHYFYWPGSYLGADPADPENGAARGGK